MTIRKMIAIGAMSSLFYLPALGAQETSSQRQYDHEQAKAEQKASDHRHHTGAKIVGGSAVGGAVVGGLKGGPTGAVIGAGVGAAGGAVANKAREHHDIKKREHRTEEYQDSRGR